MTAIPIVRRQHWTDNLLGVNPDRTRNRRRRLGNWLNYRRPEDGVWDGANEDVENATGTPHGWVGQFDFGKQSLKGAIQYFVEDTTDPDNKSLIGVRRADKVGAWLNKKARQVNQGVTPTYENNGRRAVFADLWDGCNLVVRRQKHKAKTFIRVKNKAIAPAGFRFGLRIPPGYSLDIIEGVGGYYRLLDDQGVEQLRCQPVFGYDSSTTAPTEDGTLPIAVSLVDHGQAGPQGKIRVIELVPDASDMAAATTPIFIDPTDNISGTSDLDDNWLFGTVNNYGVRTTLGLQPSRPGIFRAATGSLPAGTYTGVDWNIERDVAWQITMEIQYLMAGNVGWVEGTKNGSTETGSSCANDLAYDASSPTAWAGGGVRCDVAGTDHDTQTKTIFNEASAGSSVWGMNTVDEIAVWQGWVDTTRTNAGWRADQFSGGGGNRTMHSTEGTTPWTIDITYDAAAAGSPVHYYNLLRRQ